MSNIIDFKPLSHLKATEQLDAFIAWAQATLPKGVYNQRVHSGIRWDMDSWHNSGVSSCAFTAHGSPRNSNSKNKKYMQTPFMNFAKALIVYYRVFRGKKSAKDMLFGARILEVALVEVTGTSDVTRVSAAICNRACEHLKAEYPDGNSAYLRSKYLEQIVVLMRDKGLLAKPFRWTSPLRYKGSGTLKDQQESTEKKLPSRESVRALGELFKNDLTSPLDIITVSACALLLSQPSRIGELADVERDCLVFKDDADGGHRMFLRWYAEKGFGATTKPVVTGMEPAVERVIKLLTPITDEARTYAAWLEDNPDAFPPHEGVPLKGQDDPLSYDEACAALKSKFTGPHSARSIFETKWLKSLAKRTALSPDAQAVLDEIRQGWDTGNGKRIYVNGRLNHYHFNDRAIITLRKLNILVREKYLPKDFPYTTPAEDSKKRVKFRDALFTVRTGSLPDETKKNFAMQRDFGVEIAANYTRMTAQLGGVSQSQSIFLRHGYGDLKVNTHAFRHELNTEMHRAGLSQLLIDAFSGRTTHGSVYNHVTIEELTQAVAAVHPKTKQNNAAKFLENIATNKPLKLSDLISLGEGDQDRIIHRTYLGLCIHSFESEPCPKMGACLTCGNLGCVKGDDVKLANLKEERVYLKQRYERAVIAEAREVYGASEWRKKTGLDLLKCDALIKLLESPELENGDIVWNLDNGWNLTKNAAAMAGLIDAKAIEAPRQAALPSLDELSAMLDKIEV
ncbi:TPA: hypothetical protein ACID0D_002238 [Pseudomonas aeruginosa]|uniref:hypothetical protein n=1 Tax=Pseudomonas aeruginosa TaxID=287 RepID=UPI00071BE3BF|nr:hypothetical protein [Pseudomonas aeruginosa]KSL42399.2 hypothetical protein APA43_32895 [Pseudomonas aeruginosa]KSN24347.2 hypothetical protein APA76_32550 [Pseudomonas aeruginosa]MBI8239273.1 hypothetical protein [Pseudomonas aeruginosa]MBI8287666.1 hypothetical protein [Pseudomonas aeruginosa]MCO2522700.1 hypothetical protein [Pseudomonas aeruginosa]